MAEIWHRIARGLRLSLSSISLIRLRCKDEPEECLLTALEFWLKKKYNTKMYGNPSWCVLVASIASPAGGANLDLAQLIAAKYPGKSLCVVFNDIVHELR